MLLSNRKGVSQTQCGPFKLRPNTIEQLVQEPVKEFLYQGIFIFQTLISDLVVVINNFFAEKIKYCDNQNFDSVINALQL